MKPFAWSSFSLAAALALGAFGTHGLRDRLPADLLAVWQTGQQYHVYGSLAAMLVALARLPEFKRPWSLVMAGTLVFAGSLYLLALTGMRWLGAVTPLGGALMIGGLVWAGVAARRHDAVG